MKTKINEVGEYLKGIQQKSTGLNETTSTIGGNFVGNDLAPFILSPNFANGSIYERCNIINVRDKANSVIIPVISATKLDDVSIRGGVDAFWVTEGYTKTISSGKFGGTSLPLNPLAVIIPVTDELNEDVDNLGAFVSQSAEEAIRYKIDSSIIYGSDNQLHGILNSGSQSTLFLGLTSTTIPSIEEMYKSYYGGQNGVWVMSKAAFNDILSEYADSNNLYFNEGKAYLYGYPIIITPVMHSKDIVLGDFSQYVIGQKEIRKSINNSASYQTDETLYRFVIRINGNSSWLHGVTLGDAITGLTTGAKTEAMTTITAATTGKSAAGSLPFFTTLPTYIYGTSFSTGKAISATSFSMDVSSGKYTLTSNITGRLTSVSAISGSINYNTGNWSLTSSTVNLTVGTLISASYIYSFVDYTTGGPNSITIYPFVTNL